jgi:hypothetical protein
MFHGKPEEIDTFLTHCDMYIRTKIDTFQNEEAKIDFVLSYFEGVLVNDWIIWLNEQIVAMDPLAPRTYYALKNMIREHFGDPDRAQTAQAELSKCRQGNRTAEEYVVDFRVKARRSGFDDTALIHYFKQGMNAPLLDRCYQVHPLPITLDNNPNTQSLGWFGLAIRYDRQYREFKQFTKPRAPPPPQRTNPPQGQRTGTGTTYTGPGQSMDIDKNKRGQNCFFCGMFGHMKKDCRQRLNGCFNCGQKGHARNTCTQAPQQRVREVEVEESGKGTAQ